MDIDTFFHEKNIDDLRNVLLKNQDLPGVVFPKYQIFTPERFNIKAKMCIAFNKKKFSSIKLNGGGDLCDPTINGKLLNQYNLPMRISQSGIMILFLKPKKSYLKIELDLLGVE